MYELELTSDKVACINNSSILDNHSQLGHPSPPTFELLVPDLDQVSFLECESCQLGKHHRVSFPSRVNKKVDKPLI